MLRTIVAIAAGLFLGWSAANAAPAEDPEHGGGLNKCGCHVKKKTGECHCHADTGCGCACEPAHCK